MSTPQKLVILEYYTYQMLVRPKGNRVVYEF